MNVVETLRARHSTRGYQSDPVPRELVAAILEAARFTPSWANAQPWEVFAVTGEPLERLRQQNLEAFRSGLAPGFDQPAPRHWPEVHKQRTNANILAQQASIGIVREDKEGRKIVTEKNLRFFGAPVVIFLCLDRELDPWALFDLGAFSQSIMLAAQHYGLNTIPAVMMVAYPQVIKEELRIPENLKIVFGIALGYGDQDSIQNKYTAVRRMPEEFTVLTGF
jgi:nitroreductase